ncbi:hypothetical protein [Stenotrophomonas sp. SY1]|uniref:hypothetical protein n=1 Tax=Stenotrophomonas sp. SY1 TaxID=477235 RepID=UPI001E44C14F|nr:hypothetical protein [Stenotrophomonas sp. SY1]MCD9088388.1 hypothetical protein [Stenotrophomonas sp. SY1]
MHPRKTELAHNVLQAHRAPLDLRQRRALILCDGKRSLAELTMLLGIDAPGLIAQLQHNGYLHIDQESSAPPATPTPATESKPAVERRRSMVAARIYVLDILALQRNPVAAHLHRQLQATREEADTLNVIGLALAQLPALTSEGYAQRVHARLLEVVPEVHLPALRGDVALPA